MKTRPTTQILSDQLLPTEHVSPVFALNVARRIVIRHNEHLTGSAARHSDAQLDRSVPNHLRKVTRFRRIGAFVLVASSVPKVDRHVAFYAFRIDRVDVLAVPGGSLRAHSVLAGQNLVEARQKIEEE